MSWVGSAQRRVGTNFTVHTYKVVQFLRMKLTGAYTITFLEAPCVLCSEKPGRILADCV